MERLKLDDDIEFESEHGIHIGKYIKVEKGAVYNDQGYVTVNNYPDDATAKQQAMAKDDEDIQMAIAELYNAVDESGKKIFTDNSQWYAVFRVLKEYCNFPERITDFVVRINKNKWAEQVPFCKYESTKAINTKLPLLSCKVSLWQQYKSINDNYEKQCLVAEKLMKLLGIL